MSEKIKVTEGNSFILAIPLIAINAAGEQSPIQVEDLTELACRVYSSCGSEYGVSVSSIENRIILQVPATMPNGVYNVDITARRDEQRISLRLKDCFEIVAWDKQSNWQDYIIDDHIELTDQPFIAGYYNTDAEWEALKEELRQQKEAAAQAQAEAEAAKAEYDRKAEMLDDVAKETTLLQKSAAIIEAISGIHIDIPENIATKDDVTAAKQAILEALSHIDIDTSDLAKEATLGASPDTSVSQTIFGWLKSIRDFLVGIVSTNPYAKEATAQQAASDAAAAKTAAQALSPVALAADAYNTGKTQLAVAITSKGVETSPTESYPEMAEKVAAISQVQYDLSGSEVYASTLYGGQLNDIIATAIAMRSRGDLVGYDGMIVARYYRGHASIILNGASGYICSDEPETVYTESGLTHVWQDEDGQYMDRYIVYLYRNSGYSAAFISRGLCPKDIVVLGECGSLIIDYNRLCHIYCPTIEGMTNSIGSISIGNNTPAGNWGDVQVIDNFEVASPVFIGCGAMPVFISFPKLKTVNQPVIRATAAGQFSNLAGVSFHELEEIGARSSSSYFSFIDKGDFSCYNALAFMSFPKLKISKMVILYGGGSGNPLQSLQEIHLPELETYSIPNGGMQHAGFVVYGLKRLILPKLETFSSGTYGIISDCPQLQYIYLGYTTNNHAITLIASRSDQHAPTGDVDLELKDGWCRNLYIYKYMSMTEANMYAHILQRLKQDEPNCGAGVTITLGSTNLNKLTSEESQELLALLRGTYGYTFA